MKPLGVLKRRTPLVSWTEIPLSSVLRSTVPALADTYCEWRRENQRPFFFETATMRASDIIGEGSIRAADGILKGQFPFFGYNIELGFPPQWQFHPVTRAAAPSGHWSELNEFGFGDIKLWWEASRFSWAYALSRAYVRSQNEIYAEAFWQLFESWVQENPPNFGVNWKCGQEASLRVMAICFSLYALRESSASTPARLAQLLIVLSMHARRIDAYIDYAISQKNNHGLSEATGLWTIGTLFPELNDADRWKARGKAILESEVRRQVYGDGSYVQHSTNYHRVMLQTLAWAIRLGEANQNALASDIYDRFRKGVEFLSSLTDSESGSAPNYGANDGAHVLPLSDCTFPDMRPVLQTCNWIANGKRLYPRGPWDEETAWLNGPESPAECPDLESRKGGDLAATIGGYYTLHSDTSWSMVRAAHYVDRPSHADQLHLDLWWRGENILCDSGTYSYNESFPFDHGYGRTRYHNTATVDDADQMSRLGRFLWADWADIHVTPYLIPSSNARVIEAEHTGYAKIGVIHRRAIARLDDDTWIVVDDLLGTGDHAIRLHWLFPDVQFKFTQPGIVDLDFAAGIARVAVASTSQLAISLVRAGQTVYGEEEQVGDPSRGWRSRYYSRKEPALSFVAESRSSLPARFVAVITLGTIVSFTIDGSLQSLQIGSRHIPLSTPGISPIFIGLQ